MGSVLTVVMEKAELVQLWHQQHCQVLTPEQRLCHGLMGSQEYFLKTSNWTKTLGEEHTDQHFILFIFSLKAWNNTTETLYFR